MKRSFGVRVLHTLLLSCSALAVMCVASCEPTNPKDPAQSASHPLLAVSAEPEADGSRNVLQSALAGTWYEEDREALSSELVGYLNDATNEPLRDVCALVLPHAGYRWSGQTAAFGIKQIVGRSFQRVVVIGPSHRVAMENVASVPDVTHYATPLGEVALDQSFIAELKKHPVFQTVSRAHAGEHSVQIELPLLQQALGNSSFSFVPIVVGQLDRETIRHMADILRGLIDEQTLVVASSDFTHYGPNYGYVPFQDNVSESLKKLDSGSIERIRSKNVDTFLDYVDETGTTVCGRHAISILLAMLPVGAEVHLLHYDTSGRMTGNFSNSVSYVALAVTGKWSRGQPVAPQTEGPGLSHGAKKVLLKLARATLTYALEHRKMPTPEQLSIEITPAMRKISGVFVTLHKDGQLRGCIGEIFPSRPLYRAVMAQAINAGLNDRRFLQVQPSELKEIDFEISVLTPPHPVASANDIEIGKHGVVLKKSGHSAVFLPQVAVEQGWDRDTTLTYLAKKAGLPADAWREGATFDVFEAVVFGEHGE